MMTRRRSLLPVPIPSERRQSIAVTSTAAFVPTSARTPLGDVSIKSNVTSARLVDSLGIKKTDLRASARRNSMLPQPVRYQNAV